MDTTEGDILSSPESSGTTIDYISVSETSLDKKQKTKPKKLTKTKVHNTKAKDKASPNDWKIIRPRKKNTLYYKILFSTTSEAVQFWSDNYIINEEKATLELMQLFIDLSNNQNFNVADFLERNDMDDLINCIEICPNADYKKTGKYFLNLRTKVYEKYQRKLDNFIILFVLKAKENEFLYYNATFNFLTKLLYLMCSSKHRAIRHTGVYIAIKFITGLVIIIKEFYEEGIKIKKNILNCQENKQDTAALEIRNAEIKHRYRCINKIVHLLFETAFKKNWNLQDTALYQMRIDCILETKQWIKYLPEKFLQNDVLNITLQAVTDDHKLVRLAALQVFMNVLDNESYRHNEQLKLNMKKYIVVIAGRIVDKDLNNSVVAIDTLSVIEKYYKKLSQDISNRVLLKMYCPYFVIASAAGRYLVQKLQKISSNNIELMINLIKYQIYVEQQHKICEAFRSLLVDAIFDYMPVLLNVDVYVYILKKGEVNQLEISVLVDIFCETLQIMSRGYCYVERQKAYKRPVDDKLIVSWLQKIYSVVDNFAEYFPKEQFIFVLDVIKEWDVTESRDEPMEIDSSITM